MKKIVISIAGILMISAGFAQRNLTLDECRQLGMEHNKTLEIARISVKMANEMKKQAFTEFLPYISMNGSYIRSDRDISLLAENISLPVYAQSGSQTGEYVVIPENMLDINTRNIFTGNISFTQPVFLGGRIKELYNMSKSAVKLAEATEKNKNEELLLEIDEAYWRVISVQNKLYLAKEYRNLLAKMDSDVAVMVAEGVATKSDQLKVKVKLNEAEVMVTKAENGLQLSKMALNQLCGIDIDTDIRLADTELTKTNDDIPVLIPMEQAFENRSEIQCIEQVLNMAKSGQKMMLSRFLPNVALTGAYTLSNPNPYNGFKQEFGGGFNVALVAHVPLFHFGEGLYAINAAKSKEKMANLQLEDLKEKISLQMKQNSYKVAESIRKRNATLKNIEKAQENLNCANAGFEEGVITATDLLGAQTAWLSAKSEDIDAAIEVKLNIVYFQKSMGTLEIPRSTIK